LKSPGTRNIEGAFGKLSESASFLYCHVISRSLTCAARFRDTILEKSPSHTDVSTRRGVTTDMEVNRPIDFMNTKHETENFRRWRVHAANGSAILATLGSFLLCLLLARETLGQKPQRAPDANAPEAALAARDGIPEAVSLRILRAEDERRWDADLARLMFEKDARVRRRIALAAGRIGDERAATSLLALLQSDPNLVVRANAAFALGEMETTAGIEPLVAALGRAGQSSEIRARAIEALGKIAAALPPTDETRLRAIGEAILGALASEGSPEGPKRDREVVLMGLTAALRAHPANAGAAVARFLSDTDARVRADAANTLARLRSKDGSDQLRALLLTDVNGVVRANAARALGAAEDHAALDALINRSAGDEDERVRVSAIRSLGALGDGRATAPLVERAAILFASYRTAKAGGVTHPQEVNDLLEIATALSRILANTWDAQAIKWLREFRDAEERKSPEIEVALARIAPALYVREKPFDKIADASVRAGLFKDWKEVSSLAQGLGEISRIKPETAGNSMIGLQADTQMMLRALLDDAALPPLAAPDVLRAFAAFKSNDASEVLRKQLKSADVIMRATAAELLGELPPEEASARALAESLPVAMRDQLNDATLAILDALAKQKSPAANDAIKTALEFEDHLVRRRAVALLKAASAGDFSSRIGTVKTRNTVADYQRAMARAGKRVRATVTIDKGSFIIELLPEEAPLTVDSFVQLAQRGYFNGIMFHRVVPNFVIQGGDPRGDGNGGPGYQIRCEINETRYDTGAVGMALSGKDTGGSQWFVTHSPQPHLDGGYTVFGRILSGMDVVDRVARGDIIRRLSVTESLPTASKPGRAAPATADKAPAGSGKKKSTDRRAPVEAAKKKRTQH
jgi:cyclophilin family peptidyl-prolyl cis-trans isomerase/HEAT repeat protein